MIKIKSIDQYLNIYKEYAENFFHKKTGDSKYLYAHPMDIDTLKENESELLRIHSWSEYLESETFFNSHFSENTFKLKNNRIHLGLPLAPFAGNIKKAKFIILRLNPGFSAFDYFKIHEIDKLNPNQLFPHIFDKHPTYLHSERAWLPGYRYGQKQLKKIYDELYLKPESLDAPPLDRDRAKKTLDAISSNFAVLQLSPYISARENYKVFRDLPTTDLSKQLAKLLLEDGRILIATRSINHWKKCIGEEKWEENIWGKGCEDKKIFELHNARNPVFLGNQVAAIKNMIEL